MNSRALLLGIGLLYGLAPTMARAQETKPRGKLPNIVWITSEDHGPHLGCYGDPLARTPNLDRLAAKGMRYRMCWSNAPVCAPARTAIISGLYPTSTGSEHMRSLTSLPRAFQMYPALLRALGYYCTNRVKEDYNLKKDGKVWDDSSNKAHWRNRPGGMPFFAVFNSTKSHESQIRGHKKPPNSDPAKVRVPAYHPDTQEVRTDWAHYYDNLAKVDADAADVLRELEEAGLLDDTIIFYYSDHGSGMPRNKRTPLNSGLHVPLIVWFPERWKHLAPPEYRAGAVSNRLVSFIDLAPTLLSLAGAQPPEWMQGRAFAGKHIQPAPDFLQGFRGRMDERYDLQRSVTDGRYVYLRNYLPHLPAGQHVEYMFVTKTTQVWKRHFELGKLQEAQSLFWKAPRPPEELYDLQTDADEVRNLAALPEHGEVLRKLRKAQHDHAVAVRDVGFLPEDEIHKRSAGRTPYEMGHDAKVYPLERILTMADTASLRNEDSLPRLRDGLKDDDGAVRYWAMLGLVMRGPEAVSDNLAAVRAAQQDSSPSVRIVAAEALAAYGRKDDFEPALETLLRLAHPKKNSVYISMAALNAIDRLGAKARPGLATIKSWLADVAAADRGAAGIPRLIDNILRQLES
jgi:arylsulfatase A-like enzyme